MEKKGIPRGSGGEGGEGAGNLDFGTWVPFGTNREEQQKEEGKIEKEPREHGASSNTSK